MILNNLHQFHPFFSARAYALAELVRARAFRPLHSSFHDSNLCLIHGIKDRFLTFQHLPYLEGLSVYLKQYGQNIPKTYQK